jgi:hypothetical protein
MTFKLLIDECLSPELVTMAIEAGHVQSTCLRDRGWLGLKDWELIERVVADDFTLVTHNAKDFRGQGAEAPAGWHAGQEVHAGLVCLNSEMGLDLALQRQLFAVALEELATTNDLVNRALEITALETGGATVEVYSIPT